MMVPTFQKPQYVYRAKILKIVDGDTVDVLLDLGCHVQIQRRLRFLGIDAWEIKGEEREKGLIAKDRLIELCSYAQDNVYVQTEMDATGKYGRLLAWLWTDTDEGAFCLNQVLLEEGHGTPA